MNSSNLARRLEEYEASRSPTHLMTDRAVGFVNGRVNEALGERSSRPRALRRPRILIRDSGLRPFRAC